MEVRVRFTTVIDVDVSVQLDLFLCMVNGDESQRIINQSDDRRIEKSNGLITYIFAVKYQHSYGHKVSIVSVSK